MEHLIWAYMPRLGFHGQLVEKSEATMPVDLHAKYYGSSVFEGIRVYEDDDGQRNVFRLPEHIDRLFASARAYGMDQVPFSKEDVIKGTLDVLSYHPAHTYVRPDIYRGQGMGVDPTNVDIEGSIVSVPWGRYLNTGLHNDGVAIQMSAWRRSRADQLPASAKGAANYGVGQAEKLHAIREGFAERILLAPDDKFIAEATGMNVFIVTRFGTVATPDASAAILLGLTRSTVLDLLRDLYPDLIIEERRVYLEELYEAQEAFFTGTATEINGLTMVGTNEIGRHTDHLGHAGPITQRVQRLYRDVVHGRIERYRHWLTPVPQMQDLFSPQPRS